MKKLMYLLIVVATAFTTQTAFAQNSTKPTCIVLNMDAVGLEMDSKQMGNLLRLELDKLDRYEVVDRYDVAYLIEKNDLKIDNCFGKICLLEIGKKLEVDYMITGSAERIGETIVMTIRLINVQAETIEKIEVIEYKDLQKEIQSMVTICLSKLFGIETDANLERYLTKKNDYENAINNPNVDQLNLTGPRMGLTVTLGESGQILQNARADGGFDNFPFMTSFGYQYEIQYLNEGNFQALFEFLPMISGLDQGMVIPSLTVLHGLRSNVNGLEFAFGPTLSGMRVAEGYYAENGDWLLVSEWNEKYPDMQPPVKEKRLDSRGDMLEARPGFVFAVGFTFKSGKLNLPVNAFVIPNKKGTRVGISVGFNAKK